MARQKSLRAILVSLLLTLASFAFAPAAFGASPSPSPASGASGTLQLLLQSPVLFVIAILLILAGLFGTILVLRLLPKKRG